ncbi:MAG: OmpA family protein [bacterium]
MSDEANSELDKIVTVLSQRPDLNVLIKGYTDKPGNYSYNIKLSELRATGVKNYLVKKGLNPFKIDTVGMGPDKAIDDGGYEKMNQMNRRVEIELN